MVLGRLGSIGLMSMVALTGCGAEAEGDAALGVVTSALVGQDVLGFESTQGWSQSSGTIALTSVHSQGSAALSVNASGYTQLTSAPLSTLSGVSPTLSLDFRPAASPAWGQVQISVDLPSRGLYGAWVGQASVQGLPANTFTRLDFAVPAQVQQALAGSYADLRFKIALNAAQGSGPLVLDNLRFAGQQPPDCAAGSAYTLTISGAEGIATDVVERIRCTFYDAYPKLAADYNPSTQTTVSLTFVEETPNLPGAGWVVNGEMFFNKGHVIRNPLGSDMMVHEAMHIVQAGYSGVVPGWIIEGTADFVRDRYGSNPDNAWSIPSGYAYGQHYANGYGDAAAFFKWIDAHYRVGQLPVAQALDDVLRAGGYSDAQTWPALTGQGLEALWLEYSDGQAPQEATQGIVAYQDSDFGGRAVKLDRGSYRLIDLQARGVPNDWISSFTVPAGYTVKAYTDDQFTGTEVIYSSSASFVGAFNDQFSSLIVQ
jgi:Peptidase of plants and bacteria